MLYILSHPRLTRSAKPLAQRISELTRKEIRAFIDPQRNGQCIIRYGNSSPIQQNVPIIGNAAEHIRMAGNKLRLSEFLVEKEFPHVEYQTIERPERFPIVVRTELNRGGGIGIVIVENINDFDHMYTPAWSYWYNFQFELGVHVLGGEIKRVFKKIRSDNLEEEKYPIRNTQRGYDFSLRENWQDRYRGLDKFVKQLYELIPIQFTRLDVGYDRETGGYRLIEINSAPDLSQNRNTLNMYAEFLANRIGV